MRLYFIRHAQSANNALWAEQGSDKGRSEDPELTQTGYRQADVLAKFLRTGDPRGCNPCYTEKELGFGITHLYSSLMVRAVATGTIIATELGLTLAGWEAIHEQGGIFMTNEETGEVELLAGKDREFFATTYPEFILPDRFIDTGWWDRRPVEKPEETLRRARGFLETLLERHGETKDRVAIISHGGFYNDFLRAVIGLPERNNTWFTMYNGAITRLDFHEKLVELVYQNRVDYLPEGMIT